MSSTNRSDFPPPENPGDPGRGPVIMAVTWTMLGFAIVVVVLRCYSRIRSRIFGADDWTMLIALAMQMGCQSCYTVAFHWGLGQHDRDPTYDPQLINIQMWNFIVVVSNLAASTMARISLTLLFLRLFGTKIWFEWFLTALVIGCTPVLWTQADPIQGLWDPFTPAHRRPPTVSRNIVDNIQALLTLSDLLYVLFTVIIISRLNVSLRRKVGLASMMALSLTTKL
ncbi:hypothetical protein B0I35DRAFT_365752 [Stachybotrys elegans]|uniref:Rhodopsin domain-containing protein n=1 Tax=Stachybotrys elegans TaxID=80388 RepID=A0A8K0SF14_9HYPO|nr:hypothetical protein B0I35DRAFT_365752 [Stachybotrys elegans]